MEPGNIVITSSANIEEIIEGRNEKASTNNNDDDDTNSSSDKLALPYNNR